MSGSHHNRQAGCVCGISVSLVLSQALFVGMILNILHVQFNSDMPSEICFGSTNYYDHYYLSARGYAVLL